MVGADGLNRARPVDLDVAGRVGEHVEDHVGGGLDHTGHGHHTIPHSVNVPMRSTRHSGVDTSHPLANVRPVQQIWTIEQVAAVAPSPRSIAAAEPLAVAARWSAVGADDRALWGRCRGSGTEPYETAVDHAEVAWRCTCPSRKLPCKHALALLLLWARGAVGAGTRPESVRSWVESVSYTHLRAHETDSYLVCRLLLE